jgi:hypothetical protein
MEHRSPRCDGRRRRRSYRTKPTVQSPAVTPSRRSAIYVFAAVGPDERGAEIEPIEERAA